MNMYIKKDNYYRVLKTRYFSSHMPSCENVFKHFIKPT